MKDPAISMHSLARLEEVNPQYATSIKGKKQSKKG
jgi:hypothetical protein